MTTSTSPTFRVGQAVIFGRPNGEQTHALIRPADAVRELGREPTDAEVWAP